MRIAIITIVLILAAVLFSFAWRPASFDVSNRVADEVATSFVQGGETDTVQKPLPIELASRTVTFKGGTDATFRLPKEFNIAVAAEGLGKARFLAMSPDGRLFVPDLVDYFLSREGSISILDDFDEKTGRFANKHTYLSGLRGPNSVAFYTDRNGNDWIYIALTEHLIRYPYHDGDTAPTTDPEVIIKFPNTQDPNATSVVWHITRTVEFHNDRVYVSVGSGCNSCEQSEGELRGMVFSMDPDGEDVAVYATGLRNAVGLAWAGGQLYATENGVDHLGVAAPDDLLYRVEEGEYYGWPYCYESSGLLYSDTAKAWEQPLLCADVPLSFASFEPHSAPLGIEFFSDAHPLLADSFLVALHGSHEPEIKGGYRLVRVSWEGEQEVFMDGFQDKSGERFARPVDILKRDENSFFISDDFGGRIFYVHTK